MKAQDVDAKIQELKELIREANGLLKDAKEVRREAREISTVKVQEAIHGAVAKTLDDLGKHVQKQMRESADSIVKSFDKLMSDYLADGMTTAKDCPTIQEMFNAVSTLYHYAAVNGRAGEKLDIAATPVAKGPNNLVSVELEGVVK